jgi:hypothetical protein
MRRPGRPSLRWLGSVEKDLRRENKGAELESMEEA